MTLIDSGIYVEGRRQAQPDGLEATLERRRAGDGMTWIGLYRPDDAELHPVAAEFDLHPLAVEDATQGHQRPKLERYDDTLFTVLRPARYDDDREIVEFGELHVFTGDDYVLSIRRAESPDLAAVRARLESEPALLALGPDAVLYAMIDQVVDDYVPVVAGLENDIDEIEDELFGAAESGALSQRIYELSREVIRFQRAVQPLPPMLDALIERAREREGHDEVRRGLRDVLDHVIQIVERVDGFRALLDNALDVHATLVSARQTEQSIRQNEQMKMISGWAAILFAPTLVAAIYGMNFDVMPELHWMYGYPMALLLMAALAVTLYLVFRVKKWL